MCMINLNENYITWTYLSVPDNRLYFSEIKWKYVIEIQNKITLSAYSHIIFKLFEKQFTPPNYS